MKTTTISPRIEIIDALRGFALAGIFICHMVEQYVGSGTPEIHSEVVSAGVVDKIIEGFIFIFLRGKFIALFSFLFGLSFFIQMENGAKKGKAFGGRFLWRLLLMLGIGYIHSLFYRGDILTVYGFLGVILIPFYRLNTKWVLVFSALLFLGLGRYIIFYISNGAHLFLDVDPLDIGASHIVEYYDAIKNGDLLDVFAINSWQGHLDKLNVQFGIFGRGYFTFAFFLIGLYVGRSGFFKDISSNKTFIKKTLIYSIILFVVAILITAGAFLSMGKNFSINTWNAMIGFAGYDLINLSMTVIYIIFFIKLYRKESIQKWLLRLAPYGRMALTNYILQSLIGTFLLYGWGLHYLGVILNRYVFIIAILLIVIQIILSKYWLKYFRYGPLEWIWRSLTFFKRFPMKREQE